MEPACAKYRAELLHDCQSRKKMQLTSESKQRQPAEPVGSWPFLPIFPHCCSFLKSLQVAAERGGGRGAKGGNCEIRLSGKVVLVCSFPFLASFEVRKGFL